MSPAANDVTSDRKGRAEVVREHLLGLLATDDFGPGSPLPSERELIRICGVSRSAVREAMQGLEAQGLVEIRHGGRAKVSRPTPDSVMAQFARSVQHLLDTSPATLDHLKEARLEFEQGSAARAAANAGPDDVEALLGIVEEQAAASHDTMAFLRHDRAFHRALAALSPNPIYPVVSDALFRWMEDFHTEVVILPGRETLTIEEHREIVRAVEAGNPRGAAEAMHDHLTRANTLYHRTNRPPRTN